MNVRRQVKRADVATAVHTITYITGLDWVGNSNYDAAIEWWTDVIRASEAAAADADVHGVGFSDNKTTPGFARYHRQQAMTELMCAAGSGRQLNTGV